MVIPVYDVNPVRRTPWVTYALIAANVIIFLLTPTSRTFVAHGDTLVQTCQQEAFYHQYGAIPREMLHNRQLAVVPNGNVGQGPSGPGCVVGPPTYRKDPILSVLFAMFLHGGWLHLIGNMLFLWVFGNNVEDRLGRFRFLGFYLLCGYVAAYGFALATPTSVQALIGASGAVAGVLGAYIVLYPRARVWSLVPFLLFIPLRMSAWIVLGLWFVIQGLYSSGYAVSGGGAVAYLAHVVGFTLGVLVGLVLKETGPHPPHHSRPPNFGPTSYPHPPPSPWDPR